MNCSSSQKVLCGQKDCSICYERSFATHERALMWGMGNELQPHQVLKYSNKKYKFNCEDCGYKIEISLKNIIKGKWCRYCKLNGIFNIASYSGFIVF